jgi:1-acyl-sn-glycerol-3-phosphate acyltransferase
MNGTRGDGEAGSPVRDQRRNPGAPVRPSRALLRFFDLYLFLFLRRHFHGLRLAGAEHWPRTTRPLVICLNHPSWWDPLTAILLSRFLERKADHYAPMDALSFSRYEVLRRAGLFPVEQGTPRGAAQLLRAASHIFKDKSSVLWITPQGGFTDVRSRPMTFRAGLDALLRRAEQVTVLPLAIEYTFWNERLPEALAMLGQPLLFVKGQLAGAGYEEHTAGEQVAAALERTQNALAVLSSRRDPACFTSVLAGASGTSGIYGGWQRIRALVRRERFAGEHGSVRARAGGGDA